MVQLNVSPSVSLIGMLQVRLRGVLIEPFVREGVPINGGPFMCIPIVRLCHFCPGAGKFEAAYAWPLIAPGVFRIQYTSLTMVGAASPRNVIEVRLEHQSNVQSSMVVTLLPMVKEVREEQ